MFVRGGQMAEICWTPAKTGAGSSNLRQEVAAQAPVFLRRLSICCPLLCCREPAHLDRREAFPVYCRRHHRAENPNAANEPIDNAELQGYVNLPCSLSAAYSKRSRNCHVGGLSVSVLARWVWPFGVVARDCWQVRKPLQNLPLHGGINIGPLHRESRR